MRLVLVEVTERGVQVRTAFVTVGPVRRKWRAYAKCAKLVDGRRQCKISRKPGPPTSPFEQAVSAIEAKAAEKGFRVLHTHDVAATLAEKGFPREPLKIVEICNAKYASQVLNRDVKISSDAALPNQRLRPAG